MPQCAASSVTPRTGVKKPLVGLCRPCAAAAAAPAPPSPSTVMRRGAMRGWGGSAAVLAAAGAAAKSMARAGRGKRLPCGSAPCPMTTAAAAAVGEMQPAPP